MVSLPLVAQSSMPLFHRANSIDLAVRSHVCFVCIFVATRLPDITVNKSAEKGTVVATLKSIKSSF